MALKIDLNFWNIFAYNFRNTNNNITIHIAVLIYYNKKNWFKYIHTKEVYLIYIAYFYTNFNQ